MAIAAATPTQSAKNAIVVANAGQLVQGAQVRIQRFDEILVLTEYIV